MEDVVLHYQPGPADGLGSLLERTERLLEPFPCRPPPVFTPWFPAAAARRLPLRPAKPAPVISCSGALVPDRTPPARATVTTSLPENKHHRLVAEPRAQTTASPPGKTQKGKDALRVSGTTNRQDPERRAAGRPPDEPPQKDKGDATTADPAIERSWSVFTQRGVRLQSSQALSKPFRHMVSSHRLHLRQRARWVIGQLNCGAARGVEQVWRTLSRSARSSRLPTCNANIQRDRAEIWVFCDVACAEQVGRFLKQELQLAGSISLSVRRLERVFSM